MNFIPTLSFSIMITYIECGPPSRAHHNKNDWKAIADQEFDSCASARKFSELKNRIINLREQNMMNPRTVRAAPSENKNACSPAVYKNGNSGPYTYDKKKAYQEDMQLASEKPQEAREFV